MNRKSIFFKYLPYLATMAFVAVAAFSYGAPPPPPPPPPPPGPGIPIDGASIALLGAGLAYGAKKLYSK